MNIEPNISTLVDLMQFNRCSKGEVLSVKPLLSKYPEKQSTKFQGALCVSCSDQKRTIIICAVHSFQIKSGQILFAQASQLEVLQGTMECKYASVQVECTSVQVTVDGKILQHLDYRKSSAEEFAKISEQGADFGLTCCRLCEDDDLPPSLNKENILTQLKMTGETKYQSQALTIG